MLSALIPSAGRKPAVPLAGQLAHESCVRPGPLVLGTAFLKSPTAATDRDRHCCYHYPSLQGVGARTFLPGSACRHADRTISSPGEPGVRHMVSEDSGSHHVNTTVAPSTVHGECQPAKLEEAFSGQVHSFVHTPNDVGEGKEVLMLRTHERVCFEEGYDPQCEICASPHH